MRSITGEAEVLAAPDDAPPTLARWLGSWALTFALLVLVALGVVALHAVAHPNECEAALAEKGK